MSQFKDLIPLATPHYGPAEASHFADISKKDLSNWIARGHFKPIIDAFTPGGGKRLFAARDIITLATMKKFADMGLPLEQAFIAGMLVAERARQLIDGEVQDLGENNRNYVLVLQDPDYESNYRIRCVHSHEIADEIFTSCASIVCADFVAMRLLISLGWYQNSIQLQSSEEMSKWWHLRRKLQDEDVSDSLKPGQIYAGGEVFDNIEDLERKVNELKADTKKANATAGSKKK